MFMQYRRTILLLATLVFAPGLALATDVGLLSGVLRDEVTQAPIPFALAESDGNQATLTNPDGSFHLADNPGTYTAIVQADGYWGDKFKFTLFESQTTSVQWTLRPKKIFRLYAQAQPTGAPDPQVPAAP